MKTKLLLTALIAFLFFACKKKEDSTQPSQPVPNLTFKFGYYGHSFDFIQFANQESVSVDSLINHDHFGVSFTESKIPDVGNLTTDSLVFKFELSTKKDLEHFQNRVNTSGSSTYILGIGSTSEIGGEFSLPYKFSTIARPGNDTIEINNQGDSITVDYTSHHSSLKGRKSISLYK